MPLEQRDSIGTAPHSFHKINWAPSANFLDVPTIGAAKTRLTGHHDEPPNVKGAWAPLIDGAETIGAVVRTRAGVKPLYVSIGHRVCLNTAIELTLGCVTRYRLPETTRHAHHLASMKKDDA